MELKIKHDIGVDIEFFTTNSVASTGCSAGIDIKFLLNARARKLNLQLWSRKLILSILSTFYSMVQGPKTKEKIENDVFKKKKVRFAFHK